MPTPYNYEDADNRFAALSGEDASRGIAARWHRQTFVGPNGQSIDYWVPEIALSGGVVSEVNLDAADDEVAIFGAEGGGAGTRRIVNVDATGRIRINVEDGQDASLGATTDAESASGNGSVIALLKRLRTILTDVWFDAGNVLGALVHGQDDAFVLHSLKTDTSGRTRIVAETDAGAAADGMSNTLNIPINQLGVGVQPFVYPYIFNGVTWDRVRGTAADGTLVNLGTNNDVVQPTHDNLNANANIQVGNTDVPGGNGAATASTPRVITATDSPDVTSLQTIDDWDESDRAKVNPVVGQPGVQAGLGPSTTNTQRVNLST
ncbi:MAG: hypothetical protein ACRDGA_12395, partial [Bacteroidota bacterium]